MFFFLSRAAAFGQAVDWPTLGFTQIATNTFTHPTVITHAGDGSGRLFVVQQPGQILIVQNGNVLTQPFLDISGRVLTTGAEQGLLGLVFSPGFSTNNYFYVDYTRKPDGAIVISRFILTSTNSNVAATNSEQIILVIPKPIPSTTYNNHNAGQLAFGPDGYLYIGVGDGGSEGDPLNNGQTTNTFYGKILRIDVESGASPYAIPPSNPFVSKPGYKPETWAWGLRNPWRFSFDDLTGDLYIGDVGQNTYEEVDFQPAGSPGGQNYGWRIMEGFSNYKVPFGFTNFASLTLPVAVYSHFSLPTDLSGAVIGGYVYRGSSQPRMNGMYFYGDFEAGWIWGLKQTGTNWQNQVLVNPLNSFPQTNYLISTFGEDDQGNLYLADYYRGIVYQIQDSLHAWPPVFSVSGGVINSNTVIVTCMTPNAEIHYTTNGVNPTLSDPIVISGGSINVTTGLTNKVCAFRSDLNPSTVSSAIFTDRVGTPIFSPSPGVVTNGTLITIATITSGAAIYYSTNNATPTINSLVYSSPIAIQQNLTLEALGVENGYSNSVVASGNYSLAQAATPVFVPGSGPITNGTSISISCSTPFSTIYYTLDGSVPTASSAVYNTPLPINGGTTLGAMAAAAGYINSPVQSTFYQLVQAAAPTFNPPSGLLTNGSAITISCATPNAVIHYTLDGSTPTEGSPVYSGLLTMDGSDGGVTLNAMASANGWLDSPVQTVLYELISPENTVVTTLAGQLASGFTNGVGSSAMFSNPQGVCMDAAGNLYVADTGNNVIREISPSGQVTTFAGTGVQGFEINTAATNAQISAPTGVCADYAGNIFVADGNNGVFKIDTNGFISALAPIYHLWQLAADGAGNIYVGAWASVQKIAPDGTFFTFSGPHGCCPDGWEIQVSPGIDAATNVYAATGYGVFKTTPEGITTTYAGGVGGYSDGPASVSTFADLLGAAVDSSTNVYVSDLLRIRKIGFDGWVSTMAGNGTSGYQNGPGFRAEFNVAAGLCLDTNGNIFVADSGNNCIREISPDTYGIGIADWWQLKYFGYVGINPNSDPNNNGLTAYEDFWAGLNPTNPASIFKIESASVTNSGTTVSWDSVLGKNYTVQWSSDLVTWNTLGGPVSGNDSLATMIDTTPGQQNRQRFYRVMVDF